MVSLEQNLSYRQKLTYKPIVNNFIEFIEGREISSGNFSQLDKVLFNLIKTYRANDKRKFQNEYIELSRREPSSNSPYAYNDFLIFVLICGTKKFELNQDWIREVLDIRNCSDDECKLTTLTFKNLLSENYTSTNNHFPTIVTFQHILEISLLENDLLNITYLKIVQGVFPRFNLDFLNLVVLRAFDLIVLRKEILGEGEMSHLKSFEKRFTSKVTLISKFAHWIFTLGIYCIVIYLYFTNQVFQNFIKHHSGFFNLMGLGGLIGMYAFGERLRNLNEQIIKKFWGYTK